MNIEIKPHVVPILFGNLPSSFEEQVAGKMVYHFEGDNILILKAWMDEAEADFKQTELYAALLKAFEEFPTFDQLVLQPA